MNQAGFGISKMQQVTSIYPTTMGQMGPASTTATAVAGAETRSNVRENYKSFTWEYSWSLDQYWQIQQMAWQYAREETLAKLMGDNAQFFDPDADYTYQPVSANVEMEYSVQRKISQWDQFIGRLTGLAQAVPQVIPVIGHAIAAICELQGDEIRTIAPMIENFMKATPQPQGQEGQGGPPPQTPVTGPPPMSNQNGQTMSPQERVVRMIGGM